MNIDIDTLRLSSRHKLRGGEVSDNRYSYITSEEPAKESIGYFAGCMTHLSPATIKSMNKIFKSVGDDVWFVDKDAGVCCGRPLKLSGEVEAAEKMMNFNRELFIKSGIKTLITSCPICLRTFSEDYALNEAGVEVIHHSQYISRKISSGELKVENNSENIVAYHDPCELGRGLNIYREPREAISSVATLKEMNESGKDALCCGHSLANNKLLHSDKERIMRATVEGTPCNTLITSCPQCKSAFLGNRNSVKVKDISELIADNLKISY